MASRFTIAFGTALLLALPGGAALAQLDTEDQDSFYADPVLSDPPQKPQHAFAASVATQDIAAVSPAAGNAKPADVKALSAARNIKPVAACTVLQPCAVSAPARS